MSEDQEEVIEGSYRVITDEQKKKAPTMSRRKALGLLATGAAVVATKPTIEALGKVGEVLEKLDESTEQRQARELLLNPQKIEDKTRIVRNLTVIEQETKLRSNPYIPQEGEPENIKGILNPGGNPIPLALKFEGPHPYRPSGGKTTWYAFPDPTDKRPLEEARIVFSYGGNYKKQEDLK
ncbi:hypothetical protein HY405_00180 [Candidatus Microgenomates bacterium]|nr:hypothetical protein [Candidatus Microgenomates bacterium]